MIMNNLASSVAVGNNKSEVLVEVVGGVWGWEAAADTRYPPPAGLAVTGRPHSEPGMNHSAVQQAQSTSLHAFLMRV